MDRLVKVFAVLAAFIPLYLGVSSYRLAEQNRRWEQLQKFLTTVQDDKPNRNGYLLLLSILIYEHPKLAEATLSKILRNPLNKIEDKAEILQSISEIEHHSKIRICNMDFIGIILSGVKFDNFEFIKCRFDNAKLEYAQFKNVNFDSSSFNSAYLGNAIFDTVEIHNANFEFSKLDDTQFIEITNFKDANFSVSFWGNARIQDQMFNNYLMERFGDLKHKGNDKAS